MVASVINENVYKGDYFTLDGISDCEEEEIELPPLPPPSDIDLSDGELEEYWNTAEKIKHKTKIPIEKTKIDADLHHDELTFQTLEPSTQN